MAAFGQPEERSRQGRIRFCPGGSAVLDSYVFKRVYTVLNPIKRNGTTTVFLGFRRFCLMRHFHCVRCVPVHGTRCEVPAWPLLAEATTAAAAGPDYDKTVHLLCHTAVLACTDATAAEDILLVPHLR